MLAVKVTLCTLLVFVCCSDVMSICTSVSLSSNGFRYYSQLVPGVVSAMNLVRRYSKSPCERSASFGWELNDIWVKNGCRGLFDVCYAAGETLFISCSSHGFQPATCNIPSYGRKVLNVTVARRLSRSRCTKNSSYTFNDKQINVISGCRAVFRVIVAQ